MFKSIEVWGFSGLFGADGICCGKRFLLFPRSLSSTLIGERESIPQSRKAVFVAMDPRFHGGDRFLATEIR